MNQVAVGALPVMNKTVTRCICALIVGFIGFIFVATAGVATSQTASQLPDVTFQLQGTRNASPVKVTQIFLDGKPIPPNSPVPVAGLWLRHLVVEVKNVSRKNIVAGELLIRWPDTGDGTKTPMYTTLIRVGRRPDTAFRLKDGTMMATEYRDLKKSEINIPPGGTMRFSFEDGGDLVQSEVYKHTEKISNIGISVRVVDFNDGSRWFEGSYLLPVPPPALWKAVPLNQF